MLARLILATAAVGVLLGVTPQPALADTEGGVFVNEDAVVVSIQSTGSTKGSSSPSRRSRERSESADAGCRTGAGIPVPCRQFGVDWRNDLQCYARVKEVQPPVTAEVWEGNTTGMIVQCHLGLDDGWNTTWDQWVGSAELPPPPDPEELARRAVARMQLKPITMGTFPQLAESSPSSLGYVGWNVWMWVNRPSDATWGPITRSVSEGGYTVTATARVDKVVWDMGDGSTVECRLGKPWQSIWTHNEASPDCGHVYERDGVYAVTATSYWVVDWAGIGESGVLTLDLATSGTMRVAEVQVVSVNGP